MVSNAWDSAVQCAPDEREDAARLKALLLHIVLSHHGKLEWGSPVLPRTAEAILVHFCDILSATMHTCLRAIDDSAADSLWTERLAIMDQARRLYIAPRGQR
jgi:23S rRNA maturation-related 3'-5' exoribonuclease YhaM